MKYSKTIIIFVILLLLAFGCHTHFHVTPTFSPKMEINPKDTISKKDTIIVKK